MPINSVDTNPLYHRDLGQKTSKASSSEREPNAQSSKIAEASGNKEAELSSRAQNLQKLNDEFFPRGPGSLQISPAFIERLSEYGFINDSEASTLNSQLGFDKGGNKSDTVNELVSFVDKFSEQIKANNPDSGLLESLKKARSVILNIDSPISSAQSSKQLAAELMQYNDSTEVQALSQSDKFLFDKVVSVLTIAEKLAGTHSNFNGGTNKGLDSYLAILSR